MEPLVEIPRSKWSELRDLFRSYWPESGEACCLLDFQMAYPQLAEESGFHVYCPQGNLKFGMVAIMTQNYDLIIQPVGKDITQIEEALLGTKVIDWNRVTMVPFANLTTVECLNRIKDQLGINVFYGSDTRAHIHLLDKNSRKFDVTLPPNTFIGILRPEHIDIVDKTWTYHNRYTHKVFENLMKHELAFVLYLKGEVKEETSCGKYLESKRKIDNLQEEHRKTIEEDANLKKGNNSKSNLEQGSIEKDFESDVKEYKSKDEPLAWLSVNGHGALSHLFCPEQHRKRGYGEIITKYVTNKLLSKGLNIIAFTTEHNEKAKQLFTKLGFEYVNYDYWVIVKKN